MNTNITPAMHPDSWVDLLRPYVTHAVGALVAGGILVERSWLDPRDPRDATIVWRQSKIFAAPPPKMALVWDEETGWRSGVLESGQQGVRTVLKNPVFLGGGVLPPPAEMVHRLVANVAEEAPTRRSCLHVRDGLDLTLSTWVCPRLG